MNKEQKIFISYSWEEEEHNNWIEKLAQKLEEDGFKVCLDRKLSVGNDLNNFMCEEPLTSDKILVISTPKYTEKANSSTDTGVARETKVLKSQ